MDSTIIKTYSTNEAGFELVRVEPKQTFLCARCEREKTSPLQARHTDGRVVCNGCFGALSAGAAWVPKQKAGTARTGGG